MATSSLTTNKYLGQVLPIFGGMIGISAIATHLALKMPPVYILPLFIVSLIMIFTLPMWRKSEAAVPMSMLFAMVMGAAIGPYVNQYSPGVVTQALATSSLTFIGMAFYGATTKRDLSGMGVFLVTACWGLIVAMLIGLFVKSALLSIGISVVAVVIFSAFTAYDMQNIKNGRYDVIGGAVALYLDFMNLFIHLLSLLGLAGKSD